MKLWFRLAVGFSMVLGLAECRAGTSEVFHLKMQLTGITQWSSLTNPVYQNVKIADDDLINLGLGFPLGTPVPPNEKLGLVSACSNSYLRIIVYDTATTNNLATIGVMPAVSVIADVKGRRHLFNIISQIFMNFSPAVSNGLAGGSFIASGNERVDLNGCLLHYQANIIGTLGASFFFTNSVFTNVTDLTVTNLTTNTYFVVSNFPVNVASHPIETSGKLGTLIEP